jgi:hypothetical protein
MIEKGLYQTEIPSLSSLDIEVYERIFKLFKKSVNEKDFYVYNLLSNLEFPKLDSRYIEYYSVQTRTPLTIVSYKIYEDIKSWWIIYLLNKDKFVGAPFYVESGTQLMYISDSFRSAIYNDITQSTIYSNRHF